MPVATTGFPEISEAELQHAFDHGEFSEEFRTSAAKVVVVMTQDWCPQWADMKSWLGEFAGQAKIYVLVYNLHKDFSKIMDFKENIFGNLEIPYIRYYFEGRLITHTNWLPKGTFQALLKKEKPFQPT